jgi:hypothetical protein
MDEISVCGIDGMDVDELLEELSRCVLLFCVWCYCSLEFPGFWERRGGVQGKDKGQPRTARVLADVIFGIFRFVNVVTAFSKML